jgi:hypothetical protein
MDLLGMVSKEDVIEMTLMTKRPVNMFQIPPIASSQGHKAEDWRGKQIWTGLCRIMMESGTNRCKVQLLNENDSQLFAEAIIIDENYDPIV